MGISVITPTIREENINNIIENFERQNYERKELIIVLNYINPNIKKWESILSKYDNIEISMINPKYSLGECLNHAITKSKFDYIAKFDDDDYYGPNYLNESMFQLENRDANIIGKSCIYIYFKDKKALGLRNESKENRSVKMQLTIILVSILPVSKTMFILEVYIINTHGKFTMTICIRHHQK